MSFGVSSRPDFRPRKKTPAAASAFNRRLERRSRNRSQKNGSDASRAALSPTPNERTKYWIDQIRAEPGPPTEPASISSNRLNSHWWPLCEKRVKSKAPSAICCMKGESAHETAHLE